MNYIIVSLITIAIIVFMYFNYLSQTNKDLKIQKQNLQTKVVQEKQKVKVKSFEARQKAKKEQIVKDTKKDNNESKGINLSDGTHTINF